MRLSLTAVTSLTALLGQIIPVQSSLRTALDMRKERNKEEVRTGNILRPRKLSGKKPKKKKLGKKSKPAYTILAEAVTVDDVYAHLENLAEIADDNGEDVAELTPGYDAVTEYFASTLAELSDYFYVEQQDFEQSLFAVLEDPVPAMVAEITNSTAGSTETIVFRYEEFVSCDPPECSNGFTPFIGSTSADLENVTVAKVGNLGCEMADFVNVTDKIALILRGDCFYYEKALNAQAAGAIAVIIYNDGADESRLGMIDNGDIIVEGAERPAIPVVGVSYEDGVALFLADESRVNMKYNTTTESGTSSNFILTTKTGSPDSILLVRTYRDSEPGSPGVNDALSGPSAVMTLAKAMMETGFEPEHQVIFLIYSGLHIGTEYGLFVWYNSVTIEKFNAISVEVDCDRIASPNYIRGFRYNSELMFDVISGSFEELGLTYTAVDLLFGNDFPFGVLTSSIFPDGNKTSEEVMKFGGVVDEPYDPCYHAACDDINNVNKVVLGQLSDVLAYSVGKISTRELSPRSDESGGNKSNSGKKSSKSGKKASKSGKKTSTSGKKTSKSGKKSEEEMERRM